ncbi:hypothetical protein AX16_001166 [Volvariella volvacea WC 439]|nr:hypothetical protein AX16_001166 [Volvariella volvacea WC 439]
MVATAASTGEIKVYTVNGATAGSSSSLPDWLTRKRTAQSRSKSKSKSSSSSSGRREVREQVEGTIELIQGFEFPEASNRIKTTRDGHHAIATGTYKPQMRVWELDQLAMKFERHSDAENVDFVILSDDWTKTIHIQNDRTIELHTQSGLHYKTRIPRFGRSLAYHFPSCDAYFAATGNEVYRLNLDQGRFMTPLTLTPDDGDEDGAGRAGGGGIEGVNVIDVNPAHQLLALGIDGNGTVQFWDPRSRSSVGVLRLPKSRLLPTSVLANGDAGGGGAALGVTAISSRRDGLSYAIGTSTGHTLLYDIRSSRHFGLKDQGYGMPIVKVCWIEGGSRMAGDGMVMSADRKVVKIWDKNSPSSNFVSITPANDLNDIHHLPGSGLLLTANEGIQMGAYYIPQLGPAPRWASFLENITEEMEDQNVRSVYEDYKFVERNELKALGLDKLIGTPALKPYMHGYFLSLKLYDAARVISNPFAYAEYREKLVRDKLDKMAESRIRSAKGLSGRLGGVKVNKRLAARILKEEEREKKREERKREREKRRKEGEGGVEEDEEEGDEMDVDEEDEEEAQEGTNLLNDPRFKKVFEDPEFEVDENSREFALLNPSTVAQRQQQELGRDGKVKRAKTAVEDEEDESDKFSSDGLGSEESESEDEDESDDSSDAGELSKSHSYSRNLKQAYKREQERTRQTNQRVRLVPVQASTGAGSAYNNKNASFGQRLGGRSGSATTAASSRNKGKSIRGVSSRDDNDDEGGMEISWVPSAGASTNEDTAKPTKSQLSKPSAAGKQPRIKNAETFGMGLERGGVVDTTGDLGEDERGGRKQRRRGVRSGSKNTFRRM